MRRWNLQSLVALLVVALVAAVLTPSMRTMAAPSSPTSFKGKAAVYTRSNTPPYFVVSFTCSPSVGSKTGTLSGGWTYDVNSTTSYTGTLASAPCALHPDNGTWSTSADGMTVGAFQVLLLYSGSSGSVGTLTLFFSAIGSTKTYTTDVSCPTNQTSSTACLVITTTPLTINNASVPAFKSGNYGTLNLTLP